MKQLWEGVFAKNPVLVLALGLVPAVAITTTAMNGLVLGIVAALVLTAAAIINWVLIPHVPANAKLPVRVLVLILLVVAAYSLLLSQNPGFVASLGIFLPLIAFDDLLLRAGDEDSSFSGAVPQGLRSRFGIHPRASGARHNQGVPGVRFHLRQADCIGRLSPAVPGGQRAGGHGHPWTAPGFSQPSYQAGRGTP